MAPALPFLAILLAVMVAIASPFPVIALRWLGVLGFILAALFAITVLQAWNTLIHIAAAVLFLWFLAGVALLAVRAIKRAR